MIADVVKALARRWYVVLLGLALTVGLAVSAYAVTPPEYNARALVLLLPGANAVGDGGNPFLALSGLEQPASIVVAYFASESAHTEVQERSGTAEYEVLLDESVRGPVISVDVTDRSAEGTLSTLEFLLTRIPEELARLQVEVQAPASSVITSMELAQDSEATAETSATVRNVIAAIVLGVVVTGFAAFALDGLLLRRRMRRTAPAASVAAAGADADAESPPFRPRRGRTRGGADDASPVDRGTRGLGPWPAGGPGGTG
ncbi:MULTISPECIES: hypothetical protein [unclassified Microbacterium]|uniref:hypothetical protein n=1 Tax=unclassified Microbacterium TaxID=2609290 RepID=UPI00214B8C48|nr:MULTISPECIES: hypothetical protein [unclassified Microbacterium]MCR2808941.1 hypothetical protein [Microbacterium sp. zg.B185]WIM18642.1 hypothetical protein QNO12_13755 [Microbacterium sp. zg-B185]